MKILLVDDDRTISTLASLSLTKRGGHEVVCAGGGSEALSLAQSLAPDLILMDVRMSAMDGYETCRRLKEDHGTKNIPVIFLSGDCGAGEVQKGLSLGAIGYIPKPFNPVSLGDQVQAILAKQRQ